MPREIYFNTADDADGYVDVIGRNTPVHGGVESRGLPSEQQ